MPAAMSKLL